MAKSKKVKLDYSSIEKRSNNEFIFDYDVVKYTYASISGGENNYNQIVNGKITEINHNSLYKQIVKKHSINNIRDYCLDRFIRVNFTNDVVFFVIKSGYYGDEAGFEINNEFIESLNGFINKLNLPDTNETELIEEILMSEYGYILPELKNRNWEFTSDVKLDNINPAAGMRHVNKNIVDGYKKEFKENKYTLTCLVENKQSITYDMDSGRNYNNSLRLIDGYHRYSAANQLKLKTIDIISCY